MATFRLLDQNPQYRDDTGVICAGGSLAFFETDGTTPKEVWADEAKGTSLGFTVDLDASGRAESDVWLDGEYTVQLLNADDAQVWLRENVRAATSDSFALPDPSGGTDGQVVGIDTGEYVLLDIEGLPDPTGFSNGYLATDGETWFPATFPEAVEYDEENLPGGFDDQTGSYYFDSGQKRDQWGHGTVPTAAALTSSVAVTFPVPFADTNYAISVIAGAVGVTSNSPSGSPSMQFTNKSTTGFTANAFVGEENTGGSDTITSSIPFDYIAVGRKP